MKGIEDKESAEKFMVIDHHHLADHEPEGKCGFLSCEPRFLQIFNNIKAVVLFQCCFTFFEGFLVNGVVNVILGHLEVRYGLTSKLTGLIASGNDFGTFVVLLFIGHFIERRSKPRYMAIGVVFVTLGGLIFSLPHFLGGPYRYQQTDVMSTAADEPMNVCKNTSEPNSSNPANDDTVESQSSMGLYSLFLIGQVFVGIGSAPMFTIGLTYIDESSKAKMTSLYTGLIMCSAAIGVAVGYVVAGQTLAIYVDIDKVDVESVTLTPMDPRWVGAWWIGVVASTIAFIFIAVPFFAYPKRLPGYNELRLTRKSEAYAANEVSLHSAKYEGTLKDFPKAFLNLVKNPIFVLLSVAACCESLIVSGTAVFGAKLFQQLFHVDFTMAGMLMGIITVPGAGGGMLFGGYLVKRFNMKCLQILKLCGGLTFLSFLFGPSFLAKCPDLTIAGVNAPYPSHPDQISLMTLCNQHCPCTTWNIQPMCEDGRIVYLSPCYAGCPGDWTKGQNNDSMNLDKCTCTRRPASLSNSTTAVIPKNSPPLSISNPDKNASNYLDPALPTVTPGMCPESCALLYVFCVLCFFIMFTTFSTLTPNITAVMRCVAHEQRSFAVALQLLFGRLVGTTPGPILFGAILDSTCITWQEDTRGRGSCWFYDRRTMGVRIMCWWLAIKLFSFLTYALAAKLYKHPGLTEDKSKNIKPSLKNQRENES